MNDKEESWHHNRKEVNRVVDQLVLTIKSAPNVDSTAYMAIGMVLRGFYHWLHSAQELKKDPEIVRAAVINIVDIMIIETSNRIHTRDQYGNLMEKPRWISDFLHDLTKALAEDTTNILERDKH